MTRLATWRTALMMSLQLLPGQNLKEIGEKYINKVKLRPKQDPKYAITF